MTGYQGPDMVPLASATDRHGLLWRVFRVADEAEPYMLLCKLGEDRHTAIDCTSADSLRQVMLRELGDDPALEQLLSLLRTADPAFGSAMQA